MSDSLLSTRRRARAARAKILHAAGATPDQAFAMALEEAWEQAERENMSLRGYLQTVASGMPREDLLAIEREFTGE